MRSIPIVVLVDTREKRPLLFPSHITCETIKDGKIKRVLIPVKTKKQKLDYGDYSIEGLESCCVIERKGSIQEIEKNLYDSKDAVRTGKAFKRLTDGCKFPYLLLEITPSAMVRSSLQIDGGCPEGLIHRLSMVVAKYNLRTFWVSKPTSSSSRRSLGTALLHLMVAHGIQDKKLII